MAELQDLSIARNTFFAEGFEEVFKAREDGTEDIRL